jgi:hypothetical protein
MGFLITQNQTLNTVRKYVVWNTSDHQTPILANEDCIGMTTKVKKIHTYKVVTERGGQNDLVLDRFNQKVQDLITNHLYEPLGSCQSETTVIDDRLEGRLSGESVIVTYTQTLVRAYYVDIDSY